MSLLTHLPSHTLLNLLLLRLELRLDMRQRRHILEHFLSRQFLELAQLHQLVEVFQGLLIVLQLLIGPTSTTIGLNEK